MTDTAEAPAKTTDELVGPPVRRRRSGCSTSCRSTSATGSACIARCTTAVRRPPPSWRHGPGSPSATPASGSSSRRRPGSSSSTTPRPPRRTGASPSPRRTRSRSSTPTARGRSRRSAGRSSRCAKAIPDVLEAFRTGGGVDWTAYGPDMIEAQGDFNRPWLRGSSRHRDPAGAAGHPRPAHGRSAGPRRGRRLRRRLGGDRDRRCVPERPRGRLRPRPVLDRARPGQRPRGRRRGPGDVRGPRRGRSRGRRAVRPRDRRRGDPRPRAIPSRSSPRSAACSRRAASP